MKKSCSEELDMSLTSTRWACRSGRFPFSCLFALSMLHLDTYAYIWIHLTNSHHSCKTVWSGTEMNEGTGMSECCCVKEVADELGVECAIISTSVLQRERSLSTVSAKKCCASTWNESRESLSKRLSRIVRPRAARPPAIAGGAPRKNAPVR
jgi:hypothetical protein